MRRVKIRREWKWVHCSWAIYVHCWWKINWSGGETLTRKLTTRERESVKKGDPFLMWRCLLQWSLFEWRHLSSEASSIGVTFRVKPLRVVSPFESSLFEWRHLVWFISEDFFWYYPARIAVMARRSLPRVKVYMATGPNPAIWHFWSFVKKRRRIHFCRQPAILTLIHCCCDCYSCSFGVNVLNPIDSEVKMLSLLRTRTTKK